MNSKNQMTPEQEKKFQNFIAGLVTAFFLGAIIGAIGFALDLLLTR